VKIDAPETPVSVRGDFVALREAMRNLVENAVHHGGQSRIDIKIGSCENAPMFAVYDDGPGIPEDEWVHMRERFVQGQFGGPGSGLGLAIVSDVARTHKARLEIMRSTEGDYGVAMIFSNGDT